MLVQRGDENGFTFIEVLIAMVILVMAVIAASTIIESSVRSSKDIKEMTQATWLLEKIMTQHEIEIDSNGIDKGCTPKKEGKFSPPHEMYSWVSYCSQIDFHMSETAAKLNLAKEMGKSANQMGKSQDVILSMFTDMANRYFSKSMRELHVEVAWMRGKQKKTIALTTHIARFDQTIDLPNASNVSSLGGSSGPNGVDPNQLIQGMNQANQMMGAMNGGSGGMGMGGTGTGGMGSSSGMPSGNSSQGSSGSSSGVSNPFVPPPE